MLAMETHENWGLGYMDKGRVPGFSNSVDDERCERNRGRSRPKHAAADTVTSSPRHERAGALAPLGL